VEVDPADLSLDLVKTNVVETFEACPSDCPDPVVRDQEVFFPTHEDMVPLGNVSYDDWAFACLFLVWPEGMELGPVVYVYLVGRAPVLVLCYETVLGSDDFAFEVGG
jgi:hypothetical protein